MVKSLARIPVALAITVMIASCATSTKFQGTWADDGYDRAKIKKVLILGLTQREGPRRAFEDNLKAQLESLGVQAVSSLEGVAANEKVSRELFEEAFAGQNIDAVIVSRLVAVDEEVNYTPGTYTGPYSYYGDFYGYYHTSYGYAYSPGYLTTTQIIRVETNVYETDEAKLIWSAVSETFDPNDTLDAINSLNKALVLRLKKDGFFPSK